MFSQRKLPTRIRISTALASHSSQRTMPVPAETEIINSVRFLKNVSCLCTLLGLFNLLRNVFRRHAQSTHSAENSYQEGRRLHVDIRTPVRIWPHQGKASYLLYLHALQSQLAIVTDTNYGIEAVSLEYLVNRIEQDICIATRTTTAARSNYS